MQVLENHPQENKYFTHYGWLPDLNGETVLGNLGLRSGYHQILLVTPLIHENQLLDSPLGPVNTELELWQYPRFSSRVNTATEIFQHIIQTTIARVRSFPRGESAKTEAAGDMESVFTVEIQG